MTAPRLLHACLCAGPVLTVALCARADTITLNNGRVIQADRAWFAGSQLYYERDGSVFGLPRSLVKSLHQKAAPEHSDDPDVLKARARLLAGDPLGATQLLRAALSRDPRSVPALQTLAESYLGLGDPRSARDAAERAVRADERNARSRWLLGDILAALGDAAGAEVEYRLSLKLHPDVEVERRLAELSAAPAPHARGQFRVRYDGAVNEPLGMAVLQALSRAYEEYARRLGFGLDAPITVVLQTEAQLPDARVPEWAEGVNDGAIRVPVRGLDSATPRLLGVLRHELAHSFITARTGGNCPTWLQEGISQWLEGGDPTRADQTVAALARGGGLLPLLTLEAPFQNLPPADVATAYAESLSAVAHILRLRGEPGLVRLLSALGERVASEEALPVAIGLSYPEFQKSWEDQLLRK
jgi:tetratricopeptide (TPR) repeat protein